MEALVIEVPLGLALVASVAFLIREKAPQARHQFWKVVLGGVAFAGVGLLLLGIPGAVLMIATLPPTMLLQEMAGTAPASMADAAWGAALVLTGVWPLWVIVAYTVAFGAMKRAPRRVRLAVLGAIAYAAGIGLTYYGMTVQF